MLKKLLLSLLLTLPLFGQLSGSGTIGDPYKIYTTAGFDSMRTYGTYNKYYLLMADLDFSGWGTFAPFDTANTYFNGGNHTISNMTIGGDGYAYTTTYWKSYGLWRWSFSGLTGKIDSVTFKNCTLTVTESSGGKAPALGIVIPFAYQGTVGVDNITFIKCEVYYNYTTENLTGGGTPFVSILGSPSWQNRILVSKCRLYVDYNGNAAPYVSFTSCSRGAGQYIITIDNYMYARNRYSGHNINAGFATLGWASQGEAQYVVSISDTAEGANESGFQLGGIAWQVSKGGIIGNNPIMKNMYCANPTFINIPSAGIYLDFASVTSCNISLTYVDTTGYSTYNVYNATKKDSASMLDSTALTNFNFTTNWDMDKTGLYEYYPIFQTSMPTTPPEYEAVVDIYNPTLGEEFLPGETIPIYIATQYVDSLSLEFSENGGSYKVIVADTALAGDSLQYAWIPPDTLNGSIVIRATDLGESGLQDISDAFWVLGRAKITILSPKDSAATLAVGDTVNIAVEVQGIDSLSLFYAVDDTTIWTLIEGNIPTTPIFKDTVYYDWPMPDIHGVIWLKAANAIDTTIYTFNQTTSSIGTNMPSQPTICWSDGTDYWGNDLGWGASTRTPFMWARVVDQSCGWGYNGTHRHTTLLNDDASGYNFYYDSDYMSYADMIINGAYRPLDDLGLVVGSDTTYYNVDAVYTYGDTIIYKSRRYYYNTSDSTLRFDDLRNNIDSIYVADLSYYREYSWSADPSIIEAYNVQSSKLAGQVLPATTNLESLNDALFVPQILISGPSINGRGYITIKLDALGYPPSTELAQDVVRMFTNLNITRDYFRGIDPKARKKNR